MAPPENSVFQRALTAFQAGHFKDAELWFKKVLDEEPRHVAALNMLSILLTQSGRFAEARTYLQRAVDEYPKSDATLYNYGIVLKALQRPAEALERFTQALRINPAPAETWNNRGTVFNGLDRHEEALRDFDQAIRRNPRYAEAYCNKGNALTALRRLDEAFAAFDAALALRPDLSEAWLARGLALFEHGRGDALAAFEKALTLKPDLAEAWLGRGNALAALGRYDDAIAAFQKTLSIKPDMAAAKVGTGNVYVERDRAEEALAFFDDALASRPDLAEAWLGRGNVFAELKRYDDALTAYDRALAAKPSLAEAWYGRGNVLAEFKQHEHAFAAYDVALASKPGFAKAWIGRGNVFAELKRYDEALAAYDKALAIDGNIAEAWLNKAKVFVELDRHADTVEACDRALSLKPGLKHAASLRIHAKMQLCDWTGLDAAEAQLLSEVRDRNRVCLPFPLLSIPSSPADQLRCAEGFVSDLPRFAPVWKGEVYPHDRIRIAYVSSDLRDHAVSYLMIGLFEHHDRARFETTAISLGEEQNSDFSRRIRASFERFIDVPSPGDRDIAERIRALEIDIAVDLNGFTRNSRSGVFARRPAPIAVNYLGYSGTMGAAYMDYIIADPTVIPETDYAYYSEKVALLPDSFLVNDGSRKIAVRTPPRRELQLPETGFVFCCFNQSYKINPAIFGVWMQLLKSVDGSVLWLKENDPAASDNLRFEAERQGVAPERLVFAPRVGLIEDHLARQRQADLFLDTLPYNAHTTASDALWAGVPILTCIGSTFAGRVAASLVRALGVPELVTDSMPAYEALAMQIAKEPALHGALKDKIARNRKIYPLFNSARFARNIEAAYTTMWQRHRRGERPASFTVGADA